MTNILSITIFLYSSEKRNGLKVNPCKSDALTEYT